jgi:hypothetical protein
MAYLSWSMSAESFQRTVGVVCAICSIRLPYFIVGSVAVKRAIAIR